MRFVGEVGTDYGGLVLFEPDRLRERYGGTIAAGTNLLERFLTSDEGDQVLAEGLIVPILAIDTSSYRVSVRGPHESSAFEPPWESCAQNGDYFLSVKTRLCLADVAVLREWYDELGWQEIPWAPGLYRVAIEGFRKLEEREGRTVLVGGGYELTLEAVSAPIAITADTGKNMRVLRHPTEDAD